MNAVSVSPMQWSRLKDIDDVEPINDSDSDCLADVREVLKKHGMMERFGVALLHSHFELADDEIMLESSDHDNRTLTLQPVKEADAGENNVGTIWMLRDGDITTMAWCRSFCKRGMVYGHGKEHQTVK